MSGPLSEGMQRLVKALGDLPVTANKVADMPTNHGNHLRTVGQSFDATDAKAAAKAADADVPGGGKGSAGDAPQDLTPDNIRALDGYTSSSRKVNEALREGVIDDPYLTDLADMSRELSDALAKLPPHEGTTFRGTNLDPTILNGLQPGDTFTDAGFMSTSTDLRTAGGFADPGQPGPVIFTVDGTSGRDIDALSSNRGEAEILFDKGSSFEVVSNTQGADGTWNIHLRER